VRATCFIDRLQTEVSIVPTLLPECHLPLSPSHTDDTETERVQRPGRLVFQLSVNNTTLHGHLSAVGVAKFNESRCDGVRSVCGTGTGSGQMYGSGTVAGARLAGAGRVRESWLREQAGAAWHNLSRATL